MLEVSGLSKRYNGVLAVETVSFTLKPGAPCSTCFP